MTISIIIPVCNVENYIRKCLDSVIAQKCDGFNIECVLVDDCLMENTLHEFLLMRCPIPWWI